MDVRVAYTYINKCIWCNGSGPWVYNHCLFPKCEINAPPYPLSMLAFSQVDLIFRMASSTGVGPLK